MRILIFTSSAGTAHDSAAEALAAWIGLRSPSSEVVVESVLENASSMGRAAVALYNWIQRRAPWLHQAYWRLCELEDLTKPGTVLAGRRYIRTVLERCQPDLLISTYPHTNRGHFPFARRVMGRLGRSLRCVICCTEVDGGFGFSRNWVSSNADCFWAITPEVAAEASRRGTPRHRIVSFGPLLYPAFHQAPPAPSQLQGRPLLVLGTGGNSANNHLALLEALQPWAAELDVQVLCGRRQEVRQTVESWAEAHPLMTIEALGFQDPDDMVALYRRAWAFVARPGARTATEALLLGCPLIFNCIGSTMPQEQLARRYCRARQLEKVIRHPQDLASAVGRWLQDPLAYQAFRQRWQQHRLASNPEAVLDMLLQA